VTLPIRADGPDDVPVLVELIAAFLRGFIDDFFVRQEHRNQGLGAMALATVRQACQQLGVGALLVETGPHPHPARRQYERAGFAENGRVFMSQALAGTCTNRSSCGCLTLRRRQKD
jgi:GNAT superfamily N-acetyltransferase